MFFSPTQATKHYEVSKPTLYKDIKEGKVSVTLDAKKRKRINVAELDRVYKKRENTETRNSEVEEVKKRKAFSSADGNSDLITELAVLKERISHVEKDRDYFKEQYEKEKEKLHHNVLLLSDQREKQDKWEHVFEELVRKEQGTAKEIEVLKRAMKKQLIRYRKALQAEREKTFLERVFNLNPSRRKVSE